MIFFIPKYYYVPPSLSFKLDPVFWAHEMVWCFFSFSSLSLSLLMLWIYALSVSLPSCQSVELAFDQPWKAHGSGGECWARIGEWVGMGVGMASFRRKRLMGREVKQGGGQKEFGKRLLLKELAYSWGSFSTLEMGGSQTSDRGKGKCWDFVVIKAAWCVLKNIHSVHFCLLHLHFFLACMRHKLCFCSFWCFVVPCCARCVTQDP